MKINKLDVFFGDILYSKETETSFWDEGTHNPIFEYKKPNYLIKEHNVVVVRIGEGKYVRPQEINGMIDYLTLRRCAKKRKHNDRIIKNSRHSYHDEFIGNLTPVFAEEGYISLDELKFKKFTPNNTFDCLSI